MTKRKNQKITKAMFDEIRVDARRGISRDEIAKVHGVSRGHVGAIINAKSWKAWEAQLAAKRERQKARAARASAPVPEQMVMPEDIVVAAPETEPEPDTTARRIRKIIARCPFGNVEELRRALGFLAVYAPEHFPQMIEFILEESENW